MDGAAWQPVIQTKFIPRASRHQLPLTGLRKPARLIGEGGFAFMVRCILIGGLLQQLRAEIAGGEGQGRGGFKQRGVRVQLGVPGLT